MTERQEPDALHRSRLQSAAAASGTRTRYHGRIDPGPRLVLGQVEIDVDAVALGTRSVHLLEPERRPLEGGSTNTSVTCTYPRTAPQKGITSGMTSASIAIWKVCRPVCLDREEVAREDWLRLGAKELRPGRSVATGSRTDPSLAEDRADGGGAESITQACSSPLILIDHLPEGWPDGLDIGELLARAP